MLPVCVFVRVFVCMKGRKLFGASTLRFLSVYFSLSAASLCASSSLFLTWRLTRTSSQGEGHSRESTAISHTYSLSLSLLFITSLKQYILKLSNTFLPNFHKFLQTCHSVFLSHLSLYCTPKSHYYTYLAFSTHINPSEYTIHIQRTF